MLYNLNNNLDKEKAIFKFKKLLEKGANIELVEKRGKTLKQNAYLHLLISYFALNYGETTEYCKRYFYKHKANKDLFTYERINKVTGEVRKDLKSINDLSKSEITTSIERFKEYSASVGILLPDAEQKEFIFEVQQQVEQFKNYI